MHTSVKLNSPIELVNMTPLKSNPLISKCQIKVCYVGEQPNRNGSVITKEVANQMALSLPGSPIVGFYNEETSDFEGHERELVIDEDNLYFKDITRPYGFVDLGAQPWFEKFSDDGIEHEYLMTEGYLWTGQYPEAQRIIDKGNNQSMELDTKLTNGYWAKTDNEKPDLFIINEAVISKLCILGEDVEPCFEGASITKYQFSFDDGFKTQLFTLMDEIKKVLEKGDVSMLDKDREGSLETELEPTDPVEPVADPVEPTDPVADPAEPVEPTEEGTDPADVDNAPVDGANAAPTEPAVTYNLDEIKEYVELNQRYSALEADHNSLNETVNTLNATIDSLKAEVEELRTFKLGVERVEKENMIASFYMLSDEDKAGVVARIDELSVSDIEKELSVICVRNKVSFNLEEDNNPAPTTYNLNNLDDDDASVPAWIKAVRSVAKEMN